MILIVEDEPVTARVIEWSLLRAGHECVVAGDGSQAIKILQERDDVTLIITDVEMPHMDGLSLITALRANRDWARMPVIVVSGHNELDTVRKAVALKVRNFVLKPVVPERLLESVAEVV
jgi:two-component system chemotaxis response regulator CheY